MEVKEYWGSGELKLGGGTSEWKKLFQLLLYALVKN